ncbi:MAG: ribose 5-phosphate isomerase B [Syntrophales bacterium]|jgi:RpiB/LacA/LacB family sugar-phosphate isomerase
MAGKKIILAADHAGFALKETIKAFLSGAGYDVVDVGTHNSEPVDYPDFGIAAAREISAGKFKRGILICGSGVGMAIVANKFPGVRGALCLDEETARLCRLHNDANVLVLAGRRTSDTVARKIVETWLNTPFERGRHAARLSKISELESGLYACPVSE